MRKLKATIYLLKNHYRIRVPTKYGVEGLPIFKRETNSFSMAWVSEIGQISRRQTRLDASPEHSGTVLM